MRKRSIGSVTAIFLGTCLAPGAYGAPTGDDACAPLLNGDWSWFIGGKVAFAANGTARWTPAVNAIPPATATWTCAPDTGTARITWQNGFIDTVKLSADGTQLKGASSTGAQVSAFRTGAGNGKAAPSTKKTTPEGWTPIGNGGFGKQSTVPIGPNGPQRIGPQGRPPPKGAG